MADLIIAVLPVVPHDVLLNQELLNDIVVQARNRFSEGFVELLLCVCHRGWGPVCTRTHIVRQHQPKQLSSQACPTLQ